MSKEYHIETKCIQSGWQPKKRRAQNDADHSEHYI